MHNHSKSLAHVLSSLVQFGREGGNSLDLLALQEELVGLRISRKCAEEAFALVFPFPATSDGFYSAGCIWGSNYSAEAVENLNFDPSGKPMPVKLRMKILQDPDWVRKFVTRLPHTRFKLPEAGPFPEWIYLHLDGITHQSLKQLGVGGMQINWDMIPNKHRAAFLAGVIDSTPIVLAGAFHRGHEGFNRKDFDQELVLDADEFPLANALCGGIEGAELCSYDVSPHTGMASECLYRYDGNSSGPVGVRIFGTATNWFFDEVVKRLGRSILLEEKSKQSFFDSPNLGKNHTGIGLTQKERADLKRWAKANKGIEPWMSSSRLVNQAQALIGRTISTPTACDILKEVGLLRTRGKRDQAQGTQS